MEWRRDGGIAQDGVAESGGAMKGGLTNAPIEPERMADDDM